jgi:hypothetical protein
MTKFIAIIALFTLPLLSCSQNKSLSSFEKKYKDDNSFKLSVSGNFLQFIADSDNEDIDPEIRRLARKIRSLHILAVSKNSEGYSPRDIRRLKDRIKKENFEEVMSVKSDGGELKLLVRDHQGKPTQLVLIMDKDQEGFITMDLSEDEHE